MKLHTNSRWYSLYESVVEAIECEDDPLGNGNLSEHMDRLKQYNHQKLFKDSQVIHFWFCFGTICKTISDVYYSPLDRGVKMKCLSTSSIFKIQVTNTLTPFI